MYTPESSVLYALEQSVYCKQNMHLNIVHIVNRHALDIGVY